MCIICVTKKHCYLKRWTARREALVSSAAGGLRAAAGLGSAILTHFLSAVSSSSAISQLCSFLGSNASVVGVHSFFRQHYCGVDDVEMNETGPSPSWLGLSAEGCAVSLLPFVATSCGLYPEGPARRQVCGCCRSHDHLLGAALQTYTAIPKKT